MNKAKDTMVANGADAKGVRFALVHVIDVFGNDRGFDVCKLATNYREGTRWVTCKRGMSRVEAEAYFMSRVGG